MSDMEYHKGTLKKRFDKKISFEDGIKILQKEYNILDSDIELDNKNLSKISKKTHT